MAVYTWPSTMIPSEASIGLRGSGEQFVSPYTGTFQSVDYVADRWVLSISFAQEARELAGQIEAFFLRLRGGVNRASAWHFARPAPVGTMRGSPTLSASAARGAETLSISGSGTLKAGDMIGVSGQLFMVAADATVSGSVSVVPRVRSTLSSGAAVVWDRPTAQFVVPSWQVMTGHNPDGLATAAYDLEEVW